MPGKHRVADITNIYIRQNWTLISTLTFMDSHGAGRPL